MNILKWSWLLIGLLAISSWAQAQDDSEPEGDLRSPKDVMHVHLYYLQQEHYDEAKAAKALGIPTKDENKAKEKELAVKLKQILDGRGLQVRINMIPDDFDYRDTLSGNAVYTPFPNAMPEIYLELPKKRTRKGDEKKQYAKQWRYSAETIDLIPKLHRQVYPLGSHMLLNLLPSFGQQKVFGLAIWQYLALMILILLSLVLNFITWRLLNVILRFFANTKLGKGHFDEDSIKKIAKTASILSVVYLFYLFSPVLQLPVGMMYYVLIILGMLTTIYVVFLGLHVIELTTSYFVKMVEKTSSKSDDQLLPIFMRTIKILVVIAGSIHALSILNVNVTALIAGLSIGGLAIALASQDAVKNLIGSVMIYADKPFQLGDYVTGSEFSGTVVDIGFRSTRIRTSDSSMITVPNGKMADTVVNNMGAREFRRYNTTIGVAYYTPPALIEKFLEGLHLINEAHPITRSEQHFIRLINMGASSLDIMFVVYIDTDDYTQELKVKEELVFAILRLAESLNVHIAFPSTSVYLETMPEKKGLPPTYSISEQQQAKEDMESFLENLKKKYDSENNPIV
ncbi:MAG: mechanosensitive ion channel family protein [Aureispira sp.]|nr:mechanosensitive ion channel family protein [Aureispira sp.]